jgi:hypothetical protein
VLLELIIILEIHKVVMQKLLNVHITCEPLQFSPQKNLWLKNGKTKKWRLEDERSILQEQWPEKYYLLNFEEELQTKWKSTIGKDILKLKFSSTTFSI